MYRKEKLYRRPEVLKLKFGERIRAVRKSVGKNQKEFSALLEIPHMKRTLCNRRFLIS